MKTRTDLLNFLAEKYNLERYLEIGVQVPELNFDKIKCAIKYGVDPDPSARATFLMTSDEAFNAGFRNKFDLIFIDGLHTAEQVKKDFENALKVLSPNGFIVLHDCNPEKEEHTIVPRPTERGHWNGDVYKFACQLSSYEDFVTVDIDNGCGVWRNGGGYYVPSGSVWVWEDFDTNRKELLNLVTWDEFSTPLVQATYLFPNGNVATFGWDDQQIVGLQGQYSFGLQQKIKLHSDHRTQWNGFPS